MGDVWSALSDETRREILKLLRTGEMTAGEIADRFELTKPTISHHLNVLKQAGLVTAEKHAQTISYRLNATVFQELLLGIKQFL